MRDRGALGVPNLGLHGSTPICVSMGWGSWRVSATGESGVPGSSVEGTNLQVSPTVPGGDVEHGPAQQPGLRLPRHPLASALGRWTFRGQDSPGSPLGGALCLGLFVGRPAELPLEKRGPPTQCLWG